MDTKPWYKRKTSYPAIVGAGLSIASGYAEYRRILIPFINNGLWLCLFLSIATIRDGIEYHKKRAFRFENEATALERRRFIPFSRR